MKRIGLLLILFTVMLLLLPTHLYGQDGATTTAVQPTGATIEPPAAPTEPAEVTDAPIIHVSERETGFDLWRMEPAQGGRETAVIPYTHAYSQAALDAAALNDLGDWSNTAALICILPQGAAYN